jgi:hypothetical protein
MVPTLCQINPLHTTPSYLSKIHYNIYSPTYVLVFLVVSFLLTFPPVYYPHSSSHSCYMPCPPHPPWLDHSNFTWPSVPAMKLLIMQFSPTSRHFIPLRSKYSSHHPVLKHTQSLSVSIYTICPRRKSSCDNLKWRLGTIRVKDWFCMFKKAFHESKI